MSDPYKNMILCYHVLHKHVIECHNGIVFGFTGVHWGTPSLLKNVWYPIFLIGLINFAKYWYLEWYKLFENK